MIYFAVARSRRLLLRVLWLSALWLCAASAWGRNPDCDRPDSGCPVALPELDAGPDGDCEDDKGDCPVDLSEFELEDEPDAAAAPSPSDAAPTPAPPDAARTVELVFFWGVGCPHCAEAEPTVRKLQSDFPQLQIRRVETRRDRNGARLFAREMRRLGVTAASVPTFVVGPRVEVGFDAAATPERLRDAVESAQRGELTPAAEPTLIHLPVVGEVNPQALSLPALTLLVGLLDGINPCAMWVLLVLLSILVHVKSRARIVLFGGTFVVMSGVVYFVFMTAWINLFTLVGFSRAITIALGLVVLIMGLVNLKELVWFKQGPSLTIPDAAKPQLYRRMRAIANAASLPAAFLGIAALAFLVNLIELGCTLGLPAVYTRILSLRVSLSPLTRYAYLALYNVVYVVPLALIVAVYTLTLHRLTLSERGAKVLKAVSGTLLVAFGLLFLLAPELLG
ncbi:MAG: thioredoxin family protein [Polyangiaceae bacterium]